MTRLLFAVALLAALSLACTVSGAAVYAVPTPTATAAVQVRPTSEVVAPTMTPWPTLESTETITATVTLRSIEAGSDGGAVVKNDGERVETIERERGK